MEAWKSTEDMTQSMSWHNNELNLNLPSLGAQEAAKNKFPSHQQVGTKKFVCEINIINLTGTRMFTLYTGKVFRVNKS